MLDFEIDPNEKIKKLCQDYFYDLHSPEGSYGLHCVSAVKDARIGIMRLSEQFKYPCEEIEKKLFNRYIGVAKEAKLCDTINSRLQILREANICTRADIAGYIGYTISTVLNYEKGYNHPSLETLKLLAEKYDITTDYILGITDKPRRLSEIR